jgi:16S rRNA (uracil1498-N3)-methyltransferase
VIIGLCSGCAKIRIDSLTRRFSKVSKAMIAFGVIKPENQRFLIEKSVELGSTDFFPLITDYSNNSLRPDKMQCYIKNASEQSGRIDLARLHETRKLSEFLDSLDASHNWFSCIERSEESEPLSSKSLHGDCGFIIGPEGGFSPLEKSTLALRTSCVSLSKNILRS